MKYKVEEIIDYLNKWAIPETQEEWDNSGNQVMLGNETDSIVLSLDLTDQVIEKAIEEKANLIITHHPMIMGGLKSVDIRDYRGANIIKAVKHDISIYSAHTSLDTACGGVNYVLAELIGLENINPLSEMDNGEPIGLTGEFKKVKTIEEVQNIIKNRIKFERPLLYGRKKDIIKKVALCGGSGADFIEDAAESHADLYITGDIKHHNAQLAYEKGLMVMDITHYYSEMPVLERVKEKILEEFSVKVIVLKDNYFSIEQK